MCTTIGFDWDSAWIVTNYQKFNDRCWKYLYQITTTNPEKMREMSVWCGSHPSPIHNQWQIVTILGDSLKCVSISGRDVSCYNKDEVSLFREREKSCWWGSAQATFPQKMTFFLSRKLVSQLFASLNRWELSHLIVFNMVHSVQDLQTTLRWMQICQHWNCCNKQHSKYLLFQCYKYFHCTK